MKDPSEPNYDIFCICGFYNGYVESWVVSSDPARSFTYPIQVLRESAVAVNIIQKINRGNEPSVNPVNQAESIFTSFSNSPVVSAAWRPTTTKAKSELAPKRFAPCTDAQLDSPAA